MVRPVHFQHDIICEDDEISNTDSIFNNSTSSAFRRDKKDDNDEVIAKAETTAVSQLKIILLSILTLSMVGAAFAVYKYTRNSEQDAFERAFSGHAAKVLESIGSTLGLTLEATDAFLVSMVSHARSTNALWPFVTLPDYAVRLSKIKSISKAAIVSQYHVVNADQRDAWEQYTIENNGWVDESIQIQMNDETFEGKLVSDYYTTDHIHNDWGEPAPNRSFYLPKWQNAPAIPIYAPYNWDGNEYSTLVRALPTLLNDRQVVISDVVNIPRVVNDPEAVESAEANIDFMKQYIRDDESAAEPVSDFFYPILDNSIDSVTVPVDSGNVVGILSMTYFWRDLLKDTLPPGSNGLTVVFENKCNQSFTYQIDGPQATYLGSSDFHQSKYDNMVFFSPLIDLEDYANGKNIYTGLPVSDKLCSYSLRVYPSSIMEAQFVTSKPIYFTIAAVAIFLFTSIVFLIYDFLVERRQDKVMKTAVHSSAIVSSLFPSNVRDRLFNDQKALSQANKQADTKKLVASAHRLTSFLREGTSHDTQTDGTQYMNSNPIADLFPEATVMFADIAGFTAWSSVRQPTQVFTLLETIYGVFDKIAERRGVFKVETIGDSYVAVVGLPEPRDDHAVVMAKFARNCRDQMSAITTKLELTLGPGTVNLQLRFGLHSGPVTAGVLRGKKSRFQLFGDTVNTAARMESNGRKGWIHASQSTAELLAAAGKDHWVIKRDELVEAKGKGKMQTFWVEPAGCTIKPSETAVIADDSNHLNETTQRLIGWNCDILSRRICQILAMKRAKATVATTGYTEQQNAGSFHPDSERSRGRTVLDEVREIIELPQFDTTSTNDIEPNHTVALDPVLYSQLHEFVTEIALRYRDNSFHNFEHASHVGMSVAKLLDRIVDPDHAGNPALPKDCRVGALSVHEYSYGISSDPLTQFVCVFAALIHDVDHQGVPNAQLVKEQSQVAKTYKGKSVAEQNSVNVAWNLFMERRFARLRASICPTTSEMRRFRQLVVNTVMATDIMDKDLRKLRDARWDRAFSGSTSDDSPSDIVNRKATIVIEHIIQASDVAHTMQHWHIYRKWNQCLFKEVYTAFKCGRHEKDPSERWYEDELGFFDHYVLPLAKKLSECGVFGVSSDEYLNYAKKNREEWERRGREVVADMTTQLQNMSSENDAEC